MTIRIILIILLVISIPSKSFNGNVYIDSFVEDYIRDHISFNVKSPYY